MYNSAKEYMQMRRKMMGKILIVSTSQHPLINGTIVGNEFKARLDTAIKLSTFCPGNDFEFYIPASRHMDKGVIDSISTSRAAKNYLLLQGIPEEIIHGEDLNTKFKGDKGVYNSADEAYVAAMYFRSNFEFSDFLVACSPDQLMRWELHSVANGVLPMFFTVPTKESQRRKDAGRGGYGDNTLLYTLLHDPDWRNEESFLGKLSREIRKPEFSP